MREVIPLYKSVLNGVRDLDPDTFKRLMLALMEYGLEDKNPELAGLERTVFESWKANIDARNRDSENGKKGGRPSKKPGSDAENPGFEEKNPGSECEKHITETETETKTETKTDRKRFAPPTVEEVAAYCQERGNNVDPQAFVDFYQSKGWKVGNQPMKDWKAAVRTWEQRPERQGRASPARHGVSNGTDYDTMISARVFEAIGGMNEPQ